MLGSHEPVGQLLQQMKPVEKLQVLQNVLFSCFLFIRYVKRKQTHMSPKCRQSIKRGMCVLQQLQLNLIKNVMRAAKAGVT